MAINWGGLTQGVQLPSRVIAQLPPDNSANSFMGGLAQGLQAGSSIAAQTQDRAYKQQAMDQSKQLFPLQLHSRVKPPKQCFML